MPPSMKSLRNQLLLFALLTTAVRGDAACSQLHPGDVFIWVVASDDPDGIGFLALEPIPGGLELYMTDNAWNGTEFLIEEGTDKLVVPASGYATGDRFGYGPDYGADQTWDTEQGIFNFGTSGDSVFLYCLHANQTVNPLVGFSNAGAWAEPGLETYGAEQSALPDALSTVGSVVLPPSDNYEYKGPTKVIKTELQAAMMDPNNWEGEDDGLGDVPKSAGVSINRSVALQGLLAAMFLLLGGIF